MEPKITPFQGSGSPTIMCPACKSGELIQSVEGAFCTKCSTSFQMKKGVLDLFPDAPRQEHMWGDIIEWDAFARFYESRLWRRGLVNNLYLAISFDDELEVISQAADLKEDSALLDLACGSGIYTRPFAKKSHRGTVIGLDLSMPMLTFASKKARTEGIENAFFIHGDAHDLPFPDNQFDVVNCCGALHLFPEATVFQEVSRVLEPGGRFTAGVGRWPWLGTFGRKFRDWYQEKAGITGFYREELKSLFQEAGLTNIVFHYEKRAWFIVSASKPQ